MKEVWSHCLGQKSQLQLFRKNLDNSEDLGDRLPYRFSLMIGDQDNLFCFAYRKRVNCDSMDYEKYWNRLGTQT